MNDEDRPLASICITNLNSIRTIKDSMESILSSINDRFEVVVVDNFSNDGSREYLEQLADKGRIRLIVVSCTRGLEDGLHSWSPKGSIFSQVLTLTPSTNLSLQNCWTNTGRNLAFIDRDVRESWRGPGKGSLERRLHYHYEMARDCIRLGLCYTQTAAETK